MIQMELLEGFERGLSYFFICVEAIRGFTYGHSLNYTISLCFSVIIFYFKLEKSFRHENPPFIDVSHLIVPLCRSEKLHIVHL